ncbi:hypothetical protein ACQY0O_001737 [Thecaphora frezii]
MASSISLARPPCRLRVLIVRHGETHENVAKIIQGQLDTPLNPFGHRQAAQTARFLASTRIHRVISSPLKRALDTAQAIVSQQPAPHRPRLETDARLMERGFGVLEGKVYHGPRNKSEDTSGIEKMQPFVERLASFWNDLVTIPAGQDERAETQEDRGKDDETVLLVSHGAAISALLNEVLIAGQYVELAQGVQPLRLANCSITEILVPTVPDARGDKADAGAGAAVVPAGDLSRKTEWTVRPRHLNVQGVQFLREYDALHRLVAQHQQQRDGGDEARIASLQKSVDQTDRLFAKDPKLQARLKSDVLRGPDGRAVEADIGHGRGIGCIVRWSDVEHLRGLERETGAEAAAADERVQEGDGKANGHGDVAKVANGDDVNVDELVAADAHIYISFLVVPLSCM